MNLKDAKNLGHLSTIFESKFSEKDCLIVDDKTLNFQEFSNLIISYSKKLKVLGVTILTSLNNKSLKEIGYTKSVEQLVLKQAGLIKKSGCDGIVCSAQEAKMVRKKFKRCKHSGNQ